MSEQRTAADAGSGSRAVEIRRIGPDDWQVLRDIRLAALREAPSAFGSTYAREAAFGEAEWRDRLAARRTFLAYVPGLGAGPVGISGGYVDEDSPPGEVELVSMWVSPTARGHGVAAPLVEAVLGWARDEGAQTVHLWVTVGNDRARRLYERCGFILTGEKAPLPSDPSLSELGMAHAVA
ncbi:GNAT family N-acetyltransferase [Actinopolymorpha alba]|uniref:GNAT family N-acetyltransferase n=1 Tax=Actinopolymorpha alba TaxID=533267 RepID=UPI00192AF4E2|nr:GNAT family N-acetyltransferase [Actinopolymorpha alba]